MPYSKFRIFFFLLALVVSAIAISGCIMSVEKSPELSLCKLTSSIDSNNDGLPEKISCEFDKLHANSINVTRSIDYTITYGYSTTYSEQVTGVSMEGDILAAYLSLQNYFNQSVASCKSALGYPGTLDCQSQPVCIEECKKSNVCEAFLAQNVEIGLSRLKEIGLAIRSIHEEEQRLGMLLSEGDNSSALALIDKLAFEYVGLNRVAKNSPCVGLSLDASKLYELKKEITLKTSPGATSSSSSQYASSMKVVAEDKLQLMTDPESIFTSIRFDYNAVSKLSIGTGELGYFGEINYAGDKLTYEYSGSYPNQLSGISVITYSFEMPGNDTKILTGQAFNHSLSAKFIPGFLIGPVYKAVFGTMDSIIISLQKPFGYAIAFVFVLTFMYLFVYIMFNLFPTLWNIFSFSILTRRIPLNQMLLKSAGRPLMFPWVFLLVGASLFFVSMALIGKEKLVPSSTEYLIIDAGRKFVGSGWSDVVLVVAMFIGIVAFKLGFIEIAKRVALGKEYSMPKEDLLKLEFLELQKELVQSAERVKNELDKLRGINYDCTKFIERISALSLQKVLDVKQSEVNEMGSNTLHSFIALAMSNRSLLKSLLNEMKNLNSEYESNWKSWKIAMDDILASRGKLGYADLEFIPEGLKIPALFKYYKKLDHNKYGFQDNLIYVYPHEYIESSVFSSLVTILENQGVLHESGVFDYHGNLLQDKLHRSSCRSIVKIMLLNLMRSVHKMMELTYARSGEYVMINLSKGSVLLIWGENKVLFFVIERDVKLSDILAMAKPILSSISKQEK